MADHSADAELMAALQAAGFEQPVAAAAAPEEEEEEPVQEAEEVEAGEPYEPPPAEEALAPNRP